MIVPFNDFIFQNKEIFLKNPKDAYTYHKDIIKFCIKNYKCHDVFAEMEKPNAILRKTKFFDQWTNYKRKASKIYPIKADKVTKITKEKIQKTIIKQAKAKLPKQISNIKEISLMKNKSQVTQTITRQPINQTIEISRIYNKINFQTEDAKLLYSDLQELLKNIRIKTNWAFNLFEQYRVKLDTTEDPEEVFNMGKKLAIYERLNKMTSESFNDSQAFLVQLRMLIENEKQIHENNFYIQSEDDKMLLEILAEAKKEIK